MNSEPNGEPTEQAFRPSRRSVLAGSAAVAAGVTIGNITPAAAEPPTSHLIARWSFDHDHDGQVVDDSGNGYHGTLIGHPTYVPGKVGKALRLDGAGDAVEVPAELTKGMAAITFAAWFRMDQPWPWGRFIAGFAGGTGALYMEAKGQNLTPVVSLRDGGARADARTFGRIEAGEWHHLAVTAAEGQVRCYLDGREAARQDGVTFDPAHLSGGTGYLGAAPDTSANPPKPRGVLPGALDDVRIYDVALDAEQIQGLSGPPPAPPGRNTPRYRPARDTAPETWRGIDALDRQLLTHADVGGPRKGKFVGIFYFQWEMNDDSGLHNITDIRAGKAPWGPVGSFHFWDQPYFGYYYRDDPWVIRKHAQLLGAAGVDTLILDVTNGFTYDSVFIRLAEVLREMKSAGITVPQFCFICNPSPDRTAATLDHLYRYFYKPGLFSDLWFQWDGKPLVLGNAAHVSSAQRAFFTFRQSWAWHDPNGWFGNGHDRWPWIDDTPQAYGWHVDPSVPEETCVGIAGHPTRSIGRSFHDGAEPAEHTPAGGKYLAEQWDRALQIDPDFLYVTGWNEWIAQRFIEPPNSGPVRFAGTTIGPGDSYFVDQYSEEFSRDGEMMAGGYGDNYYHQLVNGIRRFKGVPAELPPASPRSVPLDSGLGQWRDVEPVYRDDLGDTLHRHYVGASDRTYADDSGRNDIIEARVSHTSQDVTFYVRTHADITAPAGSDWMLLYLDVDDNPTTGWLGFDVVVNRRPGQDTTSVERWTGDAWQRIGSADYRKAGNEMAIEVRRDLLGLAAGPVSLSFKWADNVGADADPMRFLDKGDTAPLGRFAYHYAGQ